MLDLPAGPSETEFPAASFPNSGGDAAVKRRPPGQPLSPLGAQASQRARQGAGVCVTST